MGLEGSLAIARLAMVRPKRQCGARCLVVGLWSAFGCGNGAGINDCAEKQIRIPLSPVANATAVDTEGNVEFVWDIRSANGTIRRSCMVSNRLDRDSGFIDETSSECIETLLVAPRASFDARARTAAGDWDSGWQHIPDTSSAPCPVSLCAAPQRGTITAHAVCNVDSP